MTIYEKLTSSKETFIDFLSTNFNSAEVPWLEWLSNTNCNLCLDENDTLFCEHSGYCKFEDEDGSDRPIIKMWLDSEVSE